MTTIDECTICGRTASNHSNPNTDYRGINGDAPPTDHYYFALDDGVESKANEFNYNVLIKGKPSKEKLRDEFAPYINIEDDGENTRVIFDGLVDGGKQELESLGYNVIGESKANEGIDTRMNEILERVRDGEFVLVYENDLDFETNKSIKDGILLGLIIDLNNDGIIKDSALHLTLSGEGQNQLIDYRDQRKFTSPSTRPDDPQNPMGSPVWGESKASENEFDDMSYLELRDHILTMQNKNPSSPWYEDGYLMTRAKNLLSSKRYLETENEAKASESTWHIEIEDFSRDSGKNTYDLTLGSQATEEDVKEKLIGMYTDAGFQYSREDVNDPLVTKITKTGESKASEYSIKEEFDLQDQDGKYKMLSKADLSVTDATNYSTYSHDELPEEVKDSLKGDEDSFGESWSQKSSINRIEALERVGVKQGDAIKLSGLEFEDFGEDLQGELKGDLEDARREMKDQVDYLNNSQVKDFDDIKTMGYDWQQGGEVENPNSEFGQSYPDYNKIGESQTNMTSYECELCDSGFKSNEALSIHHNDKHAIAPESLDGYANEDYELVDAGFTGQNSFTDSSSISKEDVTQEWWDNVASPSSKARILNKTGTPVENTFGLPIYYELTQETKAYLLGLDDFSFESKASEIGMHGGDGASFYDGKTFTCDKCGKVGNSFSDMAQEACPADVNANHQIPIFGDMKKESYAQEDDLDTLMWDNENPDDKGKQWKDKKGKKEESKADPNEYPNDSEGHIDSNGNTVWEEDRKTSDESKANETEDYWDYRDQGDPPDDWVNWYECKTCGKSRMDDGSDSMNTVDQHRRDNPTHRVEWTNATEESYSSESDVSFGTLSDYLGIDWKEGGSYCKICGKDLTYAKDNELLNHVNSHDDKTLLEGESKASEGYVVFDKNDVTIERHDEEWEAKVQADSIGGYVQKEETSGGDLGGIIYDARESKANEGDTTDRFEADIENDQVIQKLPTDKRSFDAEAGAEDHGCAECGFTTSDNSEYIDHLNSHEV